MFLKYQTHYVPIYFLSELLWYILRFFSWCSVIGVIGWKKLSIFFQAIFSVLQLYVVIPKCFFFQVLVKLWSLIFWKSDIPIESAEEISSIDLSQGISDFGCWWKDHKPVRLCVEIWGRTKTDLISKTLQVPFPSLKSCSIKKNISPYWNDRVLHFSLEYA